ncbi:MAG TPA: tetratricopeptide repeat protein [Bacteroidales bacterium]|nr:tetratricopeptide repeat protein [Bacteroidales bacterium]
MKRLPFSSPKLRYFLIAIIVALVYCNTLSLDYALDDRMIIFENNYTLQGFQGTQGIFTQDAFTGYFGEDKNLVTGGRYRPLSQFTFMIEYELFGQSIHDKVGLNRAPQNEELFSESPLPIISHAVNVLLFIILCLITYHVLRKIFPNYDHKKWYLSLPFIATLLFALHPLHTEAVANIKGRDEIMCMLGAMFAVFSTIKYMNKRNILWLFAAFAAMVFALFSKENAITFMAIIPLVVYFLPNTKKKSDYLITLIPIVLASAAFLIVRSQVLGGMLSQSESQHILNNPFAQSTKIQEIATVLITWAIYLKLLVFPYPLTHDYYPNEIEITNFSNPAVWLVLIVLGFVVYYAIRNFKKKNIIAFGIIFFAVTFSITSNLIFNVGTFMNERFLFTSLLGFAIIAVFLLQKLNKWLSAKWMSAIFIVIFSLFSILTFARNFSWKDDITLFTTDVKTSSQSIKCNISAGGSYLKLYNQKNQEKYLKLAEKHLKKAFELGNVSMEAYSLLGNVYFQKKEYPQALKCYQTVLQNNPKDALAAANVEVVQLAMGDTQIQEAHDILNQGDVAGALKMGETLLAQKPDSPEVLNLMGTIYGKGLGQLEQSITYLNKAVELSPNYVSALENLGIAYAMKNQFDLALNYLNRAHELEPDNQNVINNLQMVKMNMQK